MKLQCIRCGSYAINELAHGRIPGINYDLCDVCYWRRQTDKARTIVKQQADDAGLWFAAQTASEAYLQQELRKLHAALDVPHA